jgi:molybdenum cofactor biosynthesis protein B
MSVTDHKARAPESIPFAVITVSDTRTVATDESGRTALELIEAAGHAVVSRTIVRDDQDAIRAAVIDSIAAGALAVYLTGGTGLSPRDRTPEAVAPMLDLVLPGFGELFRRLSFDEIGPAAMLSRALAGIRGDRAVFVTPGSPAAVRLALARLVLPEAGHILAQAARQR